MLSSLSDKELPWGILTGIRPTKLVYEMLENGLDEDEINERMEKEYLCSKDKTETSIIIAKREIEILNGMDYRNGYSLYIGIPFCPTRCLYCSFTSYSIESMRILLRIILMLWKKRYDMALLVFGQTVCCLSGRGTLLHFQQSSWTVY